MRVRLGTPILQSAINAGVVQQQNAAVPRPRRRCDSVHPLQFHFGGVAHQQSTRLTCERQRGQHSSLPPFFEGIAQTVRADASHALGRRRESFCPHHFCPCGVAQSTCLPLMLEITGAKRSGAPISSPPKHCQRCIRSVSERVRCNSGWGLQFRNGGRAQAPQSNQRSGRRHKPAGPGAAPGTATISASLQQPADFFCKEILSVQLRREAPSFCSRSPTQRHDVENVASAGASPAASTILACKH